MSSVRYLIFPSATNENQYLKRIKECLNNEGNVALPFSLGEWFARDRNYTKNVLVLNWIENQTRQRGLVGLCLIVGFCVFSKVLGYDMVWVVHNKKSHNLKSRWSGFLNSVAISFLSKFVDSKISHGVSFSEKMECRYVPHPVPFVQESKGLNKSKDYYLIFGRIQRYKRIDIVLNELDFVNVIIAGKVADDYKKEFYEACGQTKADVDVFDRFLPDEELNDLVSNARGVIVANDSQSTIISGSVFHTLALGVPVYLEEGAFKEYDSRQLGIVNVFRWNDLHKMEVEFSREEIKESLLELNSDIKVMKGFYSD